MRRFATLLVAVVLLIAFMPTNALAYTPVDDSFVIDLIACQNINVGQVTVWNDGDNLYVEYETNEEWCIIETHLEVATSLEGIAQTKKGNPKPGQFTYSSSHELFTSEYTYTIPLEWEYDTELFIAAHAVVVNSDNIITLTTDSNLGVATVSYCMQETAWGDGYDFPGRNWATYFIYELQELYRPLNLPTDPIGIRIYSGIVGSYYDMQLYQVGDGYDIEDGYWMGWTPDSRSQFPVHDCLALAYSSCDPNLPYWLIYDENWDYVNYLLNNKDPTASWEEIQAAIWYFTEVDHANLGECYYWYFTLKSQAMIDDTLANGAGFQPSQGQVVAVILAVVTPGFPETVPLVFIEV